MGFFKVGDNEKILEYYNADGDLKVCPLCGKKLVTIFVDGEGNKLICDECDINEEQSDNDD